MVKIKQGRTIYNEIYKQLKANISMHFRFQLLEINFNIVETNMIEYF